MLTAVIIRNTSPTTAVPNINPHKCFYGKKLDVSNFKVFGCTAYAHILKEQRKKWDVKSVKCIFIGCSVHSKGYRLWDLKAKRIHISRDVILLKQDFDGRIIKCKEQSEPKSVSESVRYDEEAENENQLVDEDDDGNNDNNNADEEVVIRDEENLRRSERAPEREGIITGNWWEFTEDALYSCADSTLGRVKYKRFRDLMCVTNGLKL